MAYDFVYPFVRINPEYKFDEILSGYNYNFSLISGGTSGGLFTGGTVDNITVTGGTFLSATSVSVLSADTIYSGSTNLYDIFGAGGGDVTRVQPGTNIATGGTDNFPIISLENDIILNSTTLSALTVNGQSVFSGETDVVTIYGSGDTSPVFSVQGSSGELFAVTDSLTGSLFSVNDISGLPILEVFDDDTILMGSYAAPSLNSTAKVTANSGQTTVYSIPASAYTGAFFDYTVVQAGGARSGNVMAIWSGTSNIEFLETPTTDIGDSSDLTFDVAISGTDILFRASANTNSWTVKTIVRSI